MVWSHQDFEREVRRQMIEVAALRKRVPANTDLHERLDMLEESQHYILRKLDQLFGILESDDAGFVPPPSCGADATSFLFGSQCSSRSGAHRERTEGTHRDCQKPADAVGSSQGKLSLLSQEAPPEVLPLPDIQERCGSCGELLLSSLLAGGEVTYFAPDWHHRDCLQGNSGQKDGALN